MLLFNLRKYDIIRLGGNMINENQIEQLVEDLIQRVQKANVLFLKNIGLTVRKIKKLKPSDTHKLIQILRYGGNIDDILKEISKYSDLNIKELEKIMKAYAKKDQMFYEDFYKYRRKPFIPLEQNDILLKQTEALTKIAKEEMYNFTRNNVLGYTIKNQKGIPQFLGLKETYNRVLDEAFLNVSQGTETFDSAMANIMREIGGSGLKTLNYESGRSIRLDSAASMHLKSRLRELHNENQKIIGEEIGADGVEISVHENPAPDHQYAQGHQLYNKEFKKLQKTGKAKDINGTKINLHREKKDGEEYETHRPISEMNCYHNIFSIIVGVNAPEYNEKQLQQIIDDNNKGFDYNGKHYTNYEGTQLQRNLERKIREQKDIQILGVTSGNKELIYDSQNKIDQLTKQYKELSIISGLSIKKDRLRVPNYKRVAKSKLK